MTTKLTTKSSTAADQTPAVLTIDRTPPEVDAELLSPLKVQPIRNGLSRSTRSSAPLSPGAWRFVAGCPVPLPVGLSEDVDAGVVWPHPSLRGSWPWYPLIWRRPTEDTDLGGRETLTEAQASYDTAVAALQAAGYTVQD